jgi:parallel beta-helix repeat protein
MELTAPFSGKSYLAALLCCTVLLPGCRLRDSEADDMVIPELVRTHLYVAQGGSDSNPGTEAEPFKTMARAAQAVTPATTVHVAPGVYPGGFTTAVSGTAEARIVFESTERWGAKIVPPLDSHSKAAWQNRGDHVDIVGFEVDGTQYQSGVKWVAGIENGGSHDTIRANHVHHIATDVPCDNSDGFGIGVDSYYRGARSDVIGNSVHDVGPAGCRFIHGIYLGTPSTAKNNIVYRATGAGIHLWHDANNIVITGNTVTASTIGIAVGGGDFYHTKGPHDHSHVYNNIVFDNRSGIIEQGANGPDISYRNNLVFQNADADWKLGSRRSHTGTVAAAPQFLSYSRLGTPDFRLADKSPAVGKGIATFADEHDFHGKPRGKEAGYDIGACQH